MLKSDSENHKVRFIHASDIHLGTGQYQNPARSDDFIKILKGIIDLAISKKVSFILLGGDVFGSLDLLPEQLSRIVKILKDFKEKTQDSINIIAIEGNHDIRKYSRGSRIIRRQSWLRFLQELDLLVLLDVNPEARSENLFQNYDYQTKKGGKIRIGNVVIYGTSYLGRRTEELLPKIRSGINQTDGCFHILLQHFGIKGQMKNVPGMPLYKVQPLKDCIHYLALGHYHLQFKIGGWIFNPGSGEAVSSVESNYKRGIFLGEITEKNEVSDNRLKFSVDVKNVSLKNRDHMWVTIYFPEVFQMEHEIISFITEKLTSKFSNDNKIKKLTQSQKPILYLVLRGNKPLFSENLDVNILKETILNQFPVVSMRIYEKYVENTRTLETFIPIKKMVKI
ncbi:exonuclease SbcCD subunit D [Promethearchaeum syntrophicum]|uniref:Exonuclease SbcCD subunit D n=1 Tax=Promethearchaeum syntrophicum TaxID=2594042 RepID=A0A5B9D8B4_9ARCH|nr:DNA repair exonuclease [Candidatus Prometheoarchaeum syntrophicum]QEE15117.1 DNA double-strand break repair protein Mre11 [Candidatus Prometheoarchaeum syntrophicum]